MVKAKKGKLIIHYNNIATPFAALYYYESNILVSNKTIFFKSYQIEDGIILNTDILLNEIKDMGKNIIEMDVLFSLDNMFKSTISLPKMAFYKSGLLYNKELKNSFGNDYKDKYYTLMVTSKGNYGKVFYTYFIPLNVINYFNKLKTELKVKSFSYGLFASYLQAKVKEHNNEDFVYLYYDNNLYTYVVSCDNKLITTKSFSKDEDIVKYYTTYVCKHFYELEKKEIVGVYTNVFDKIRNIFDAKAVDISFYNYTYKGDKLWKRD